MTRELVFRDDANTNQEMKHTNGVPAEEHGQDTHRNLRDCPVTNKNMCFPRTFNLSLYFVINSLGTSLELL